MTVKKNPLIYLPGFEMQVPGPSASVFKTLHLILSRNSPGKTLASHFSFLVFGHFWRRGYENTKILRNLCLNFARQDGQDGKKITQLE